MNRFIVIILLLFSCSNLIAQQELSYTVGEIYEFVTSDGNILNGKVISISNDNIVIDAKSLGEITLLKSEIAEAKIRSSFVTLDKEGNSVDYHNSTYNILSPNGYTLKKGQSYYQNVYLFFNSVTFGVTDNFQITGGFEALSLLFNESSFPLIFISPKFSIPLQNEKLTLGLGATAVTIPFNDDLNVIGVTNASLTYGSRNTNLSIGTGFGFSFNDGFTDEVIPIQLGGMKRLSRKISLTTDNTFFFVDNDIYGIASLGLRYHFNDSGSAFNFALFRPTVDSGSIFAFPFASVTIAFGKK